MRYLRSLSCITLMLVLCASTSVASATLDQTLHRPSYSTLRLCKNQRRLHTHVRYYCATIGELNRSRIHPRRTTASGERHIDSAAVIEPTLAAPCENTQITPSEGNIALVREATFCLINQERASHNELPLLANRQLEQSAEDHSSDMVARDYFAHYTPSGQGPAERIDATGYIPSNTAWRIGENIAWGTLEDATPQSIVEAWIASPEHLENILQSRYRDTGIGVVAQAPAALAEGQPGAIYTQDFGIIEG